MLKKLIYLTITLVLFTSSANAWGTKRAQRITLLPIEQANISESAKISDGLFANAMHIQLARLRNFQLTEYAKLSRAFEDQLVDDAVFELLVTDEPTDSQSQNRFMMYPTTKLAYLMKSPDDSSAVYGNCRTNENGNNRRRTK